MQRRGILARSLASTVKSRDIKPRSLFNQRRTRRIAPPPPTDEKKTFFAGAWSDRDSDEESTKDPTCLMAKNKLEDDNVKVTDIKPGLLKGDELIEFANCLIDENATYTMNLDDILDEVKSLRKENELL